MNIYNSKISLLLTFSILCNWVFSQRIPNVANQERFADLAFTLGDNQGSLALSYANNWKLGKKHRWSVGAGARLTSVYGTKLDYTTAPARLSRATTIPFLIVLSDQKTENWDTLNIQRAYITSLNLTANFGYDITPKLNIGCNIDVVGLTLGNQATGILTSNGTTQTERNAKPSPFNLLLTGDNDLGTLNSEFFLRYKLGKHFHLRAIYQFLFTEYKTNTIYQVAPDGSQVDRFRNKANNFGIGLTYAIAK